MRKVSAVLAACALSLAACGSVTDPADVAPEEYVEPPTVDAAAVEAFGEDEVDQAFAELTQLCLDDGFPTPLLRDPQDHSYTADELAGDLAPRLTPEALEVWQDLTASAADGDEAARDAVRVVRFFDIDEPTWQPVPEEEPLVRQQISGVEIAVATPGGGEPVLEVSFTHTATLQYLDATDEQVQADVRKAVTYHLTPAPSGSAVDWLIATFDGDYSFPTAEQDEPD